MVSSIVLSFFFGSGCFSLVRFSTGVVPWDTPNGTVSPVVASPENAGSLLVAAAKETTGFTGSALFVPSSLSIACIIVLSNPGTMGFETDSRFSVSLVVEVSRSN